MRVNADKDCLPFMGGNDFGRDENSTRWSGMYRKCRENGVEGVRDREILFAALYLISSPV